LSDSIQLDARHGVVASILDFFRLMVLSCIFFLSFSLSQINITFLLILPSLRLYRSLLIRLHYQLGSQSFNDTICLALLMMILLLVMILFRLLSFLLSTIQPSFLFSVVSYLYLCCSCCPLFLIGLLLIACIALVDIGVVVLVALTVVQEGFSFL